MCKIRVLLCVFVRGGISKKGQTGACKFRKGGVGRWWWSELIYLEQKRAEVWLAPMRGDGRVEQ